MRKKSVDHHPEVVIFSTFWLLQHVSVHRDRLQVIMYLRTYGLYFSE